MAAWTGVRQALSSRNAPVVPVPGGHHYVCPFGDKSLRKDGERVGFIDSALSLRADGQLLGAELDIISGARLDALHPFYNQDIGQPLLNGDYGGFPAGSDGDIVVSEAAGFVTLYKVVTTNDPVPDATYYAPAIAFNTGTLPPRDAWPLDDALQPFFDDGEGRRYRFRGLRADGNKALYSVNSHVIGSEASTNVLYETPVQAALVEVSPDGSARGFRTLELGADHLGAGLDGPNLAGPIGRVIDLGGDDLLLSEYLLRKTDWVGWLGGKPWYGAQMGMISPDARWFANYRRAQSDARLEPGPPPAICLTPVGADAKTTCVPAPDEQTADVLGFAGFGLNAANASDPPRVLTVSQSAAFNGQQVSVFGVRFGASGTLKIGDTPVPASDIMSWEERRIVFTMTDALPDAGVISVDAATGSSAGGRVYRVHRTERVNSPFEALRTGAPVALAQGLNIVDLGDIEVSGASELTDDLFFSPQTRMADGRYVIGSDGGVPEVPSAPDIPEQKYIEITLGGYKRILNYQLVDALADPNTWQIVGNQRPFGDAVTAQPSAFVHLAGDLINLTFSGHHPYSLDRGRVLFAGITPGSKGLPDFWRARPDGSAWVRYRRNNSQASVLLQTGWSEHPIWGTPRFADQPTLFGVNYLTGVDSAGDTVLITGADPLDVDGGAAFALSQDGGMTYAPHTIVGADILGRTTTRLREPIRVDAAAGIFFLALESPQNAPGLLGAHSVGLDGSFTPNIAEIPPGLLDGGMVTHTVPPIYAVKGGEVLLYNPAAKALVRTDFDEAAPASGSYTWETLPTSADAAQVVSFYQEPGTDAVFAVLEDGTIMHAQNDWSDWSELILDFDLPLATVVHPTALARMPDGRWLVSARLYDGRAGVAPDTPSPLAKTAYLVSPAP